ncbi:MarR family winged helix-turn-helix transcriptional regulator [Falsiruegeria mediterranea]|uniref:Organic hydroperoxide resistance transcriptional regulator n=1 Tax=Falsiruegeria mediterranea M17 TaxID=1200281 RepID=A0A2R8CF85_9RHOB|nr:MarR family transcriptional regulator [Falsiruegeria mediterranea]SPJ31085.1 Organic hydroperoxide resistance transcriptional regulator [Falsiruegeria mediterranea M17]
MSETQTTDVPTRADELFCYGIYTTSHAVSRAYAQYLKRLGLTYPQYITLTLLWEKDRQKVNTLAKVLRMETSTMTPLVKRLEGMGLVCREPSLNDRRVVEVVLTDHGRALQAQAPAITGCMIEQTGMTQSELQDLQHLLFKLRDGLLEP